MKVKNKLEEMLKVNEGNKHAELIITNLIEQCGGNPVLAEAVCKDDKNWDGCWAYVRNKAREQAINNCACIADDVVYQWASDYFLAKTPSKPKTEAPKPIVDTPKQRRVNPRPRPVKAEETADCGQIRMVF